MSACTGRRFAMPCRKRCWSSSWILSPRPRGAVFVSSCCAEAAGISRRARTSRICPIARAAPIAHHTDPMAETNAKFGHVCAAYAHSPLAVVAVLEGAVMGGAFGLACAADVAIASHTVDFRLPETSLGVIPAQIAPFLVERLGYAEAKRLSVTGARFGAGEAYRIGLVHKVCENSVDLEAAIATTIQQILRLRSRRDCGNEKAFAARAL